MASNPALDKLAQSHLLGLIQPEDIANVALSLASDASRMGTAQSLPVEASPVYWRNFWRSEIGSAKVAYSTETVFCGILAL
jgi:hypothetical protein